MDSVESAIIETLRVKLRRPRIEDAPALFRAYTADPDVTKYLTWPPHQRDEETEAFVADRIATRRIDE